MGNNSNAFKAIIALIFIMVGVFVYISYTGEDSSNNSQNLKDSSTTVTNAAPGEDENSEAETSALSTAALELCDCFTEVLELNKKIAENADLEYELKSQIKKAEIKKSSCYTKTKQRHSGFGEELDEEFALSCPDAQDEL